MNHGFSLDRLTGWTAVAALVAVLAVAPRLQRLAQDYDGGLQPASDELEYYELGRSLGSDGVFSEPGLAWSPSAHRGLLYPSFIALVSGGVKSGPGRVRVVLFLVSMACFLLTWRLAAVSHCASAGVVSGLLFAVAPRQIAASASLYIEGFYTFCLICSALALVHWARDPNGRRSALLGCSIGVGLTCRSVFFAFPAVLAAWGFLRLPGFRRRGAALLIAFSFLPLVPWTVRNYRQFREFIPLERHGATWIIYTASIGVDAGLSGDDVLRLFHRQLQDEGQALPASAATQTVMLRVAMRNIAARPLEFAAGVLRRCLRFAGMIVSQLHWVALVPLLVCLFSLKGNRALESLWVMLLYFMVVHAPMSVSSRYAIPVLPVLCVLAGAGIVRAFARRSVAASSGIEGGSWLAAAHAGLFILYGASLLFLARESAALPGGIAVSKEQDVFTGHRIGLALSIDGRFCDALGPLEAALSTLPRNPATASKALSDLAVAEYQCGRRGSARDHLRRALALDPSNESAAKGLPVVMRDVRATRASGGRR